MKIHPFPFTACFVGPHPDDVEIGAGGTIKKLTSSGWNVYIFIVTNVANKKTADARRDEAKKSARILGVPETNIFFMNFTDGELSHLAQGMLQKALFQLLKDINPCLVFAPAKIDKHPDHIAVCSAVQEAARTRGIIHYHILHHINQRDISAKVAVDIDDYQKVKKLACLAHKTEVARGSLSLKRLQEILRIGAEIGRKQYELFDVTLPVGYNSLAFEKCVNTINDLPFSRFWVDALDMTNSNSQEKAKLKFVVPTISITGTPLESMGRRILEKKLNTVFPELDTGKPIVDDRYRSIPTLQKIFATQNCLFSGGSLVNLWVLRFIHCYPSFVFRKNQFIRPLTLPGDSPAHIYKEYLDSAYERAKSPLSGFGAVIVMWGWGRKRVKRPTTIYAAGVTRHSTLGALNLLINPTSRMCDLLREGREKGLPGIQVNFKLKHGEYDDVESIEKGDNSIIKITKIDFLKYFPNR